MSDTEQCLNRLQLDLMLIIENFLCELNSHIIIIWPFRLNITFGWLQKLNPGYEICIISYQVNLSSEVSAMFNSLMHSLNIRSLPFVVFLGGFRSRCQNLSSGAIRPGGLLYYMYMSKYGSNLITTVWVKIKNMNKIVFFCGRGGGTGEPTCQQMQTSPQWRNNKRKQ